jgi:magnesium-transporting ATPase (P-type)
MTDENSLDASSRLEPLSSAELAVNMGLTNRVAPSEEHRIVPLNGDLDPRSFCSNKITTSQYTPFDFLPKFLFFSFLKLANAYFLMVSVLQMVPEISNTDGVPTTAPVLALILFIDAIFQILEDLERHRADGEANNRKAHILSTETRTFEERRWVDVTVGSVIKIYNKEPVPADVLLMVCASSVNNPDGICNVETKELDGETNLKPRFPLEAISDRVRKDTEQADLTGLRAEVKCELPNRFISKFSATCEIHTAQSNTTAPDSYSTTVPVDLSNVLLRGSTLHSVEYCYALVLNTGVDTKIMQNMGKPDLKQSTIDRQINVLIVAVVVLLIGMCSCGAIGSSVWNHTNMQKTWYFAADQGEENFFTDVSTGWEVGETVVTFFYFFLITSQYVSVSLYVSMTMVKFLQRSCMQNLLSMYHEETDTPMKVHYTLIHPYTHTPIHPYTHTLIHSYTHTLIHSYTHTLIHPYTHTLIHPYTHTPIHPYTHTLIHSYTHTLIHYTLYSLHTALTIGTHYGPHTPCTHTLHSL